MTDFVISVRNVKRKKGVFGSEPGPTRYLSVPANKKVLIPGQQINRRDWVAAVMAAAKTGNDPVTGADCGEILVFVHGYNNDPPRVLARHRLLAENLRAAGFPGVVVSFDWPSNDVALNYLEDRGDARKSAIKLVEDGIRLFTTNQMRGCAYNVHVLAHSMGAFVVREAFDDADDRRFVASVNWTVSQIAFISADISARSMSAQDSKTSSLFRHCVRLTNYQNPFDSVLKLSNVKRVGVAPRVGRVGLPAGAPEKSVNIGCGPYFHELPEKADTLGSWAHSWQFADEGFAKDLALTLHGDIDRSFLPTRKLDPQGGLLLAP
jgi:esterase/lipase superfamily enzyme